MNIQGLYTEFNGGTTSADASGTITVQAASEGKKYRITDVVIAANTAMWVKLQDNTATPVNILPQMSLPGTGVFSKSFSTPLQVPEGKSIDVLTSGSGTVSVKVTGYAI